MRQWREASLHAVHLVEDSRPRGGTEMGKRIRVESDYKTRRMKDESADEDRASGFGWTPKKSRTRDESRRAAPCVEGYTRCCAGIVHVACHQIAIIIGPSGHRGLSVSMSAAPVRVPIGHDVPLAGEVGANTV
jgi:hypothetical protein